MRGGSGRTNRPLWEALPDLRRTGATTAPVGVEPWVVRQRQREPEPFLVQWPKESGNCSRHRERDVGREAQALRSTSTAVLLLGWSVPFSLVCVSETRRETRWFRGARNGGSVINKTETRYRFPSLFTKNGNDRGMRPYEAGNEVWGKMRLLFFLACETLARFGPDVVYGQWNPGKQGLKIAVFITYTCQKF